MRGRLPKTAREWTGRSQMLASGVRGRSVFLILNVDILYFITSIE